MRRDLLRGDSVKLKMSAISVMRIPVMRGFSVISELGAVSLM